MHHFLNSGSGIPAAISYQKRVFCLLFFVFRNSTAESCLWSETPNTKNQTPPRHSGLSAAKRRNPENGLKSLDSANPSSRLKAAPTSPHHITFKMVKGLHSSALHDCSDGGSGILAAISHPNTKNQTRNTKHTPSPVLGIFRAAFIEEMKPRKNNAPCQGDRRA